MVRQIICLVAIAVCALSATSLAGDDSAVGRAVDDAARDLGSPNADVRDGAEVRLYEQRPDAFVQIEAASKRKDLPPQVAVRLKDIVDHIRPWVGPRQRRARAIVADWQWNERNALASFDAVGKHNAKWDALARKAIMWFVTPADRAPPGVVREALEAAIQAECDDPLVLYMEAYEVERSGTADLDALDRLYRIAAEAMEKSAYPANRKCFTYLRYCNHLLFRAQVTVAIGQMVSPELTQTLNHYLAAASDLWPDLLHVQGIAPGTVTEAGDLMLDLIGRKHIDRKWYFDNFYGVLDQAMPHRSEPLVFKGNFYTNYAWDARGGGYANTVTQEGWKLMKERLGVAEATLTQAWEMNPNDAAAATAMLRVELGQGKGQDVMETWFKRAIKADPDNLQAYRAKMLYLEPKWHGSPEDMLEFGHECRDTKNWYGQIPTLLVEAHETLASHYVRDANQYFGQPQVWDDLQSFYRPWLAAHPDEPFSRSRFAYYACRCRQFAEAKRQFELLGDKAVPRQFGGEQEMERYRRMAMDGAAGGRP